MSRVGGKRRDYDGDTGTALCTNSVHAHAPVFFVRFRSRFSVRFSLLSFSRASVESAPCGGEKELSRSKIFTHKIKNSSR